MKSITSLILFLSLFTASTVFAAENKVMMAWHSDIPTTQEKILERLNAEAKYFSFETDEGRCGGEVIAPELVDYSVTATDDGNEVHHIVVTLQVSQALDYCASENLVSCQVSFDILSLNGIVMHPWDCE